MYSETELNVLDLTLRLENGFISTDVYAKPTDSHLYLPYSSAHPIQCKNTIPYGVALRIKRNCSDNSDLSKRCEEYKRYLVRQEYPKSLVDKEFNKALKLNRKDLLHAKVKPKKKVYPFVTEFNPRAPNISQIISKHKHLISTPEWKEIFPDKSIITAYRRPKNLKDILAPSKFAKQHVLGKNQRPGCFKCKRKCDLCNNFLKETDCFRSFSTGRSYKIKQEINCGTTNIVYLISCKKCNVQYVGSTSTEFKVRFRNHKSAMLTDKKVCEMAVHFNENKHEFKELEFVAIEKVDLVNGENANNTLLTREAYWMAQLSTISPYGLNKRSELRSKNRIHYKL